MRSAERHHIIAIGASTGVMEEIITFFDHTPLEDVSYVIIQHLSPDVKSGMVERLARHGKPDVEQAENGVPVRSNQVYLTPNDKFRTISGGCLYLSESLVMLQVAVRQLDEKIHQVVNLVNDRDIKLTTGTRSSNYTASTCTL